jgi:hypothetical protein
MKPTVKKLYNEAKVNLDFQEELKLYEPDNYKPKLWWDKHKKVLYACLYMGYLIGKGKYNENNYK